MTDEKWEQLVELAKAQFRSVKVTTEPLFVTTADGDQQRGTKDILEFENPSGHFQLVRENHPVVLEKKEFYSHRAGDTARAEYKFSDTEFSHKLRVYKEDRNEDWQEVSGADFGL